MKITEETVDRISTLAKLSFDVKEKDELISELYEMADELIKNANN